MTDSELIHALIDYAEKETTESSKHLIFDALDLMGRLIVERDTANLEIYKLQNALAVSQKETRRYAQRWPEAIEEFVKRLKKKACSDDEFCEAYVYLQEVDEVAKEMTRRKEKQSLVVHLTEKRR